VSLREGETVRKPCTSQGVGAEKNLEFVEPFKIEGEAALDFEAVVVLPPRRPAGGLDGSKGAPFVNRATAAEASSTVTWRFFFGWPASGRSFREGQ
jgi:hypothetical protein